MLELESPRWAELEHACGPASGIPPWLAQLADLPGASGESEPWFSLGKPGRAGYLQRWTLDRHVFS